MYTIDMMSKADIVKGHGVLSAHDEQVALVKETLNDIFTVTENDRSGGNIIHYHSINPELFLTIPFMKRKGVTVGYVHFLPETVENSISLPRWMKTIFYKYMLIFYKKMDYLVTVNPYFIPILEKYGIMEEKIHYIPNFVSSDRFYPLDKAKRSEARRAFGLEEDCFTVLCVGQLQMRKGVMDFIQTAKMMPDVQFVWAGDFAFGKISDGYEEIKEAIANPPSNVKFLGLVDRERMNQVYNMADTLFLPSYEELFPMTILESMCVNIPVLVRDLDIYKPILADYVVSAGSNKEFTKVLKNMMCDSEYYSQLKEKSSAGNRFYGRENISLMWREYYTNISMAAEAEKDTKTPRRRSVYEFK